MTPKKPDAPPFDAMKNEALIKQYLKTTQQALDDLKTSLQVSTGAAGANALKSHELEAKIGLALDPFEHQSNLLINAVAHRIKPPLTK